MKTLWQRLSENQQLVLLKQQTTYPSLYGSIITDLKNTNGWHTLSVDTANHLINDLTKNRTDFITDLYNIFDNEKI
jgi:hypothetical protein